MQVAYTAMMATAPPRRGITARALLAGLALAVVAGPAAGQGQRTDWPARTVTVVVPFAAGGNTDIMARLASRKLSETFNQTFVVENRDGAGGAIAASYVAHAAPDGYTLLFAAAPQIAVLPHIQKVSYDPLKDFTPASIFGIGPFILAIGDANPSRTIPEFIAHTGAGQFTYGSGGVGSVGHLAGALFAARAGINAVHVPYRGGAPAMTGLLGGQVDMYFGNASEIIPYAEAGKVRIIGVATEKRMKQLPDVPTVGEIFPGFTLSSWNGFLAPARTPAEIVDKLAKAVVAATKDDAVIEQLRKLGIEAKGTTPQEFAEQIAHEQPQFDLAIAAANLRRP